MRSLPHLASLGRAVALAATAAVLLATTVEECQTAGSASFAAGTTCGPAGEIALSFSGEDDRGCDGCWALLEAPGASAVGLPEQGEIGTSGVGVELEDRAFALVGPAPVAGATPPRSVERTCRFTPSGGGVLEVACSGEAPEAACSGTLTRVAPPAGTP